MTLNILEPDRQINGIDNSGVVSPRRLDTEEKRIEFLEDMLEHMKKNTGTFDGPPGFLDILSQSLCDNLPTSRCLALDILCGIIPGYVGNHLDMLFPQLLQNLLHHHTPVKKATLQVLHLYFKYSQDKSVILDFLIKYGIKSEKIDLRNEVFLTMPALIRSGFTQKQLENIFISILSASFSVANSDSTLPIVLCLEHIKDEMGDVHFSTYFNSLDKNLRNLYKKVLKHCLSYHHEQSQSTSPKTSEGGYSQLSTKESSSSKKNRNVTDDTDLDNNVLFGFVPRWIILKLDNGVSWQERSDVINEFLAVVSTRINDEALKTNCGELLKYICVLIEDLNFNVALTSLTILHKVIVKIGPAIKYHIDLILKALVKKLHDPKLVVKKINLRIALSLMHSVTPAIYIQHILPLLKHKSARVREEIINMITASLLSFPSSYFDLTVMPSQFSFALIDSKRRVRHASLECLAILAQKLGSGKLSPLVSAIDKIENGEGGKGVLAAVQARLARRMLPRINDEGYVQYALTIPTGVLQIDAIALDVAWVIAGTTSDSGKQLPEKRYFSAGKKKLPWQADEAHVETPTRKDIGSAPIRKVSVVYTILHTHTHTHTQK